MAHLSKETIAFLRDLSKNNDREWFNKNKKRYEQNVKGPWEEFVAAAIERLAKADKSLAILPKDAIFRIFRDTRFSTDKTPYKNHVSAVIAPGGRQGKGKPGIYVHLSHEEFGLATGVYAPEKDDLLKIRRHIMKDGKEFAKLLKEKKFSAAWGEVRGEKNKVLPPEFKEAAKSQPLLYNKQFYFWRQMKPDEAFKDGAIETIVKCYEAARPVNAFLFKGL